MSKPSLLRRARFIDEPPALVRKRTTTPAAPLALPEPVKAWARGRCDRILRARADGTVTLTLLLPGETLESSFPSGDAAAAALAAGDVRWVQVAAPPGTPWSARHRSRGT